MNIKVILNKIDYIILNIIGPQIQLIWKGITFMVVNYILTENGAYNKLIGIVTLILFTFWCYDDVRAMIHKLVTNRRTNE